jgi:hypothetical protein
VDLHSLNFRKATVEVLLQTWIKVRIQIINECSQKFDQKHNLNNIKLSFKRRKNESVFRQFSQAKFGFGSSILSLSQFLLHPYQPLKMTPAIKAWASAGEVKGRGAPAPPPGRPKIVCFRIFWEK